MTTADDNRDFHDNSTLPGYSRAQTDAQDLAQLGYKQEFRRDFGGFSNFALSFSVISILTGAVTLYDYGLSMGGPREMTLGWPVATFGTLLVVLSMAELCSAFPTSGGMIHWSAKLGGRTWAWFTAWFNIVGLVTVMAGIDYGCAQFVLPLLGWQSTTTHLLLAYGILLLSQTLLNHFSVHWVAWLNDASVPVHIVGVLVLVGALVLFAPKQPIHFLLQASSSSGLHFSYAWLFLLGLLQAQWTYTGFDASAHVAEETLDPRRSAPWGMVTAVGVSGIFGYLLILSLTLAIPNIHRVLNATDAGGNSYPAVLAIVQSGLGNRAAVGVVGLTALAMWFCGVAACTSLSRTIYAFSRDQGMPFSQVWSKVSEKRKTPVAALWLAAGLSFASMVYSGAYSIVTSISVVGFYLSYGIPIYLGWKNKSQWIASRGPWHLGRFSNLINFSAIVWTTFICVVMVMPPNSRAGWGIVGVIAPLYVLHLVHGKYKISEDSPEPAQQPSVAPEGDA